MKKKPTTNSGSQAAAELIALCLRLQRARRDIDSAIEDTIEALDEIATTIISVSESKIPNRKSPVQ